MIPRATLWEHLLSPRSPQSGSRSHPSRIRSHPSRIRSQIATRAQGFPPSSHNPMSHTNTSRRNPCRALLTAAAHRPTAPRVPSSVTPAAGWTQSAAQGGVSMDSHPGGPDNTGVGLRSPLIYFKDIPHTPSPSPFPWRDSLLLLAHLTLSLCPHGAGWEK